MRDTLPHVSSRTRCSYCGFGKHPMDTTITIALIAGLQVILLAVVTSSIQARKERRDAELKSKEKAEDYARQDLVAERVALAAKQAADAAALLLKAQRETIARTDEVARLAAEAAARVDTQLKASLEQGNKIHILVNSDMTAARTAERNSLKLLLIALRRISASGQISPDESKEIEDVEQRIAELDQILADRLAAQHRVDESERLRTVDKLKG
jgi:hypothetical protein